MTPQERAQRDSLIAQALGGLAGAVAGAAGADAGLMANLQQGVQGLGNVIAISTNPTGFSKTAIPGVQPTAGSPTGDKPDQKSPFSFLTGKLALYATAALASGVVVLYAIKKLL